MAIQIGETPSPTFAEPLALLSDCHRRVKRFLAVLLEVAETAAGGPLDLRQRDALATALRYFREAAPRHTADEEESLFPRMRVSRASAAQAAFARLADLEADHRAAGPRHELIDRLGSEWLVSDRLTANDALELTAALRFLRGLYDRHIEVEDHEIFPVAAALLTPDDLRAVGIEMARRRGLDPVAAGRQSPFHSSRAADHAPA